MIELTAQLEQVTDVRFVHTPARPGDANICQVSRRSSLTPQYSSASIIRRGLHGHTNVYKGIADIASAVAVVTTLGLLIASVRENTAVMRATAAAESRDSLASMNDLDLMLGEKHIEMMLRFVDPTAKFEDFTEAEKFYLWTSQRRFFRRAEAQYFRYRNGLLDEDAWQTVRNRVWTKHARPGPFRNMAP